MLSKKDIQFIRSLTIKKYRQKYHKYFAEGEKIGLEIIRDTPGIIEHLFCLPDFFEKYKAEILQNDIPTTQIPERQLAVISQLKTPNQLLVLLNMQPSMKEDLEGLSASPVLYLDQIRDPGNMGTLLRSAEWFGISQVLLSPSCVDIYNPKVVQSAMGSLFRVKHSITSLDDFLSLNNTAYHIYFAEMHGENAFEITYRDPMILVLGNESRGITLNLGERRISSISIPGKGQKTESLNVSVAGSILMAEITRR